MLSIFLFDNMSNGIEQFDAEFFGISPEEVTTSFIAPIVFLGGMWTSNFHYYPVIGTSPCCQIAPFIVP